MAKKNVAQSYSRSKSAVIIRRLQSYRSDPKNIIQFRIPQPVQAAKVRA
jgi:hypothetical protein